MIEWITGVPFTWEDVAFLSVIIVCITAYSIFKKGE
jgi:hypothetical protein